MALATNKLTNANVALFFDGAFVDVPGGGDPQSAEAVNMRTGLASFGHSVTTFTNFDTDGWKAALAGQDVLVIPEMENNDLSAALDWSALYVIREFVANGGTLVVSDTDDLHFLNLLFGTTLEDAGASSSTKQATTAGTTFADDPANLDSNDATNGIETASLPTGALSLYTSGTASTVAAFAHGKGQVVFLGWDWFDAKPEFDQDGGWLQVLDSAISRANGVPSGAIVTGTDGNDVIGAPQTTASEDFIDGGDGKDQIAAGDGVDHVGGGKGKDQLFGEAGNDLLNGGKGDDAFTGGAGDDTFVFDTKLKKTGVDQIADFTEGDRIVLYQEVFGSLGLGDLDGTALVLANKAFTDAHHIIYSQGKGKLWYDVDGKGGADKVLIAELTNHATLSHGDILVV